MPNWGWIIPSAPGTESSFKQAAIGRCLYRHKHCLIDSSFLHQAFAWLAIATIKWTEKKWLKNISCHSESVPAYLLHSLDAFLCPWMIASKHPRKMHENLFADFMWVVQILITPCFGLWCCSLSMAWSRFSLLWLNSSLLHELGLISGFLIYLSEPGLICDSGLYMTMTLVSRPWTKTRDNTCHCARKQTI